MRKSGTSITGHRKQGAAMQALHRPLHPNACLDKEREVGAGRTNWGATSRILHEERFPSSSSAGFRPVLQAKKRHAIDPALARDKQEDAVAVNVEDLLTNSGRYLQPAPQVSTVTVR